MSAAPDGRDDPETLTPAESLALIDAQSRRTEQDLRPHPLALYLPWGLAHLVAFGAVWLTVGPGVLPRPFAVAGIGIGAVGAVSATAVTLVRSHRGVDGPSRWVAARYGWSWPFGFAVLLVANSRLEVLGVPPAAVSLIWSSSALLVVGLLTLAGGLLWPGSGQYLLGVWMLVSAALSAVVGYPTNFLVLALAGGGGFVVFALVAWSRERGA